MCWNSGRNSGSPISTDWAVGRECVHDGLLQVPNMKMGKEAGSGTGGCGRGDKWMSGALPDGSGDC